MNDPLATFEALFRLVCDERDGASAAALWADDADVTLFGSELTDTAHGPAEVRSHMDAIARSSAAIRFSWDDTNVHVEGEVAWVAARGTLTVDSRAVPYQCVGVLVRRDDDWRWHTFSGSEPRG